MDVAYFNCFILFGFICKKNASDFIKLYVLYVKYRKRLVIVTAKELKTVTYFRKLNVNYPLNNNI